MTRVRRLVLALLMLHVCVLAVLTGAHAVVHQHTDAACVLCAHGGGSGDAIVPSQPAVAGVRPLLAAAFPAPANLRPFIPYAPFQARGPPIA